MLVNRQLEDGGYFGTEQNNNNSSSEQELLGLSALTQRELEVIKVMMIRMLERSIGPVLEPLIRKVVHEEINLGQEKILTSMNRDSGNEMHPSDSRSLELRFLSHISLPVLTGEKIKGDECESIKVALFDALTGEVVDSGPLASAKVELLVLEGDFESNGQDWTLDEFNQKVVREWEGKGSLLTGHTFVNLKEGVGVLDGISFKHNSTWMKRSELRVGARFVDIPNGIRVREAKTEPFTVRDRRNELYKKHNLPSLDDEVWRLKKIRREGPYHKRLSSEHINTVKDFMREHSINPKRLQDILRVGNKVWDVMVEHARTCTLDKTVYTYHPPNSQPKIGVVFNVVGQVLGLLSESHHYVCIDELSDTDKATAHNLVVSAFDHSDDIVSYDDERSIVSISEIPSTPLLENPSGSNIDSSLIIDGHNHTQPSTSYAGPNTNDYSSQEFENDWSVNSPFQFTISPIYNSESTIQSFVHQHTSDDDTWVFDNQNFSLGSPSDLGGVADRALLAKRNWTMLVTVLRLKLKRVAIRRIRATKRQRRC